MNTSYFTQHIMIDLESLSTRPDGIILTIGAIKFNPHTRLGPLNKMQTFYHRIDIDSCRELNMHESPETVAWWYTQNKDVRYESLEAPDRVPLKTGLMKLTEFIGDCPYFWSQGNFDYTLLSEAYRLCEMIPPWSHFNIMDSRTLFFLTDIRLKEIHKTLNQHHNSLTDAYVQVIGVKRAFARLKGSESGHML